MEIDIRRGRMNALLQQHCHLCEMQQSHWGNYIHAVQDGFGRFMACFCIRRPATNEGRKYGQFEKLFPPSKMFSQLPFYVHCHWQANDKFKGGYGQRKEVATAANGNYDFIIKLFRVFKRVSVSKQ